MKVINDIYYTKAKHEQQKLDIYIPESDNFKTFIYFHGGGLESGDKSGSEFLGEELCKHNIALVSTNYRMYPEAHYPDFICDAAAAASWVYKNMKDYGNCTKFFIGGTSAGGYLSMMLCFDKKYLAPYKIKPTDFKGYFHDAGQPTTHFNVLRERGLNSNRVIIDEAAPIYHIGTSDYYSPMMFIVSDNDMANRYEQTKLTISALKNLGYDESKVFLTEMQGTHCNYVRKKDENGEYIFPKIIIDFIESL